MPDFSQEGLSQLLRERIGDSRYSTQIETALALAFKEHSGQFREQVDRKAKPVPYIVHPVGVAILASEFLDYVELNDSFDDIISACLTHDLLEDTEIDVHNIERTLSSRTAEVVMSLTKDSLSEHLSREQRNEALMRKIIAAGNTAMFIKICDHCHNISRPNQTPPHLLEKAIRRGQNNFLKFFEPGRLPSSLKKVYLERLQSAEHALANLRRHDANPSVSRALGDAISHCVHLSDKKVLEIHDISAALRELTNANFVKPVNLDVYLKESIFTASPDMDQKIRATVEKQASEGLIEFSKLPKSLARSLDIPANLIYVLDFTAYASVSDAQSIIIGVDKEAAPDWLNVETLRVIVSYLSERMRFQMHNEGRTLAMELARLKLELDISDVRSLHLTKADLQRLRRILDLGKFIRSRTEQVLEFALRHDIKDRDIPFIESRCKSARSIVRKMTTRGFNDFAEVDDIVGFRIVCLSMPEAQRITKELRKIIGRNFPSRERSTSGRRASVVPVESRAGYKASHLYYLIKSDQESDEEISCEFQVRTIFQDAWARVSHELAYRAAGRDSAERDASMKHLAKLRDDADDLIEGLSEERRLAD